MATQGDAGLGAVVEHLLASVPSRGRVLAAVDGVGASGKTTVAAGIARAVRSRPVLVLHADDFFHPPGIRHARGRESPEGFWLDGYDLAAMRATALEPLRRDGDGRYVPASFDRLTGRAARPVVLDAPDDALVLVEGTFLHRDELADLWDWSVYLDIPLDESARRMGERDGVGPGTARSRRYGGAQQLYFAAARPWERASLVVDGSAAGRLRVIDPAASTAARVCGPAPPSADRRLSPPRAP
jgi:uridine kinase